MKLNSARALVGDQGSRSPVAQFIDLRKSIIAC
jgi:hypothetical protein